MKVTDWEMVADELREWLPRQSAAVFGVYVAKHTREVPAGLATRMHYALSLAGARARGETVLSGVPDEARDVVLLDATPEACAALDALPARVADLEAEVRMLRATIAGYEANEIDVCKALGEQFVRIQSEAAESFRKRLAEIEAQIKGESDRGDALARRLQREHAIARQRELRLTDALSLLDEAAEALTAEKRRGLASRVTAFLNAPTSIPEPLPDPRDAFVCFAIEPFASGELPADQAEVFRQHLPGCATCRKGLAGALHQAAIIAGKEDRRG